jgi:5'-methylthioadenosine phosphorylase
VPAPTVTGSRLGLVLGSGLPPGLLDGASDRTVETAWGAATVHEVGDPPGVVLLRRHHPASDAGHVPAHRVDHHANVAALCAAGCDRVLALASVGSLRQWPVGTRVVPFDVYAPQVNPSYHDDVLGHRVPGFDEAWRDAVLAAWEEATDTPVMDGGVYAQTTGPRFESPAEVRALAVHADVVGMTVASEMVLAGEAGLAYAALCTVDNLANGLAEARLTLADVEDGSLTNRNPMVADLRAVLPLLAVTPRTGPLPG